jgi:two-component system sensor histidine kinase/response regulator
MLYKQRITFIPSLFLLLTLLSFCTTQTAASDTEDTFLLTHAQQAWLSDHPKIQIGIMNAWPPMNYVDNKGQPKGIGVDFIKALNRRLGDRLEVVPGSWREIYDAAKKLNIDALMDITPRPNRETYFHFTRPYITVPHVIFTRKNQTYVSSLDDLSGMTVSIEHGFFIINVLKKKYPSITLKKYANTSDALDALTKGEVDAFVGNRAVAMRIIENELISNIKAAGKVIETSSVNAIGVRKDWPILRDILQKALDDISAKERSEIIKRHTYSHDMAKTAAHKTPLLTTEQQAWLDEHKPFQIGLMDGWPPFNFVDEQGVSKGIGFDYLTALNRRLGHVLQPVPGEWKRIYQDVKDKRLDLIMDITPKQEREPFFNFTTPYLEVPHVIVAPKSSSFLGSEEDLENKTLALEQGFGNVSYFQQHHPGVKLKLYTNTALALDAVSRGDADAYAGNRVVALHLMEKRFISNLRIHGSLSKPTSTLAIGVRKDRPILRDIIQCALDDIDLKEHRNIISRWIGPEQNQSDQPILKLTAAEYKWLHHHQTIPIGIDGNWPPIDFIDSDGKHRGISADYLHLISKRLGIQFLPQKSEKFRNMLQKVISGELKVGATISYKKERAEKLFFTRPFFKVHKVIIARSKETRIGRVEDLYHRRVAIEDGFLTMRQLQENHPEIDLIPVESTLKALQMVSWGQADAYVGNQAVAGWLQRQYQLDNLRIVGNPGLGTGPQNFAVSKTAHDWKPFVGIINKALASISDEERLAIEQRWLGKPEQAKALPRVSLTPTEERWLREHKSIRLGVDANWAPLEFIDAQGNYKGLSSEYMQIFAQQLGINWVKPRKMPWTDVLKELKNKNLDVTPLLTYTPERALYLNYTKNYLDLPTVIFNRRGNTLLSGLDDLSGKKVASIRGYAITNHLKQDHPGIELKFYTNVVDALHAVSVGEVDAYVGSLAVGGYLIGQEGLTNLQVAAPTKYRHKFSIGVRNDWPELVNILNKAIDSLDDGLKNEILQRWYTVKYEQQVDYTIVWQILAAAFLVLSVGTIWNMQIRRSREMIQKGRERLELTLKSAQLGAWEAQVNTDNSLKLSLDEIFYRHHGIPSDKQDLSLDDLFDYIDKAYLPGLHTHMNEFLSGQRANVTFEYRVHNQARWIYNKAHALLWDELGHPKYIVGITQDITEQHKAHEALAQANRFKSEFLANMSHEIRTPMNAIIGLGHLLSKTALQIQQQDYVQKMQISAQSLLSVIDDILDFSKIEAGRLSIESIPFIFADVFENLSITANTKIGDNPVEFLYDFDTSIPHKLKGDPYRIGQILTNLVSNAIKFTEKGSIVVRVMVKEKDEQKVRLVFEVEDTGIGISPEKLVSLFEPFTQADGSTTRKYGGTGLGLSICQQLCLLMGGSICAISKPGKGSMFRFELPLKYVQTTTPPKPPSDLHGLKVLLVDDNTMALSVLSDMLESMTFHVTKASSGKEALVWLKEHDTACDLVLIDWRMPEMDGNKTALNIGQTYGKDRPIIIMMTAYGRDIFEQNISNKYLDGILVKPLTSSQLFDAIIRAYESKESKKSSPITPIENTVEALLQGKILLVEDSEINQLVAKELLENMGLEVDTVDDGQKALDYVEKHHTDLILMDIQMPVMDGYEATRGIREKPEMAQLPIFAMTANALIGDAEKSIEAGMNGHISKPVNPDELYRILAEHLPTQEPRVKAMSHDLGEKWEPPEQSPDCIDLHRGIKQVGGNPNFYLKLLRDFVSRHGNCVDDLKKMVENSKLKEARRVAHTLKGVGGNIGADQLQQSASELENCLAHGERPSEEQFHQFSLVCESLLTSLSQLIPNPVEPTSLKNQQEHPTEAIPIDKAKLDALLEALSTGAVKSIGLFEALKPALACQLDRQEIAQLDDLIESYEFEQAETLLRTTLAEVLRGMA